MLTSFKIFLFKEILFWQFQQKMQNEREGDPSLFLLTLISHKFVVVQFVIYLLPMS